MNQNLILALGLACSALLAGACTKAVSGPNAPSLPGQGEVSLTVRLGAPSTKVAAQTEANEKMIRNVQVFVFRAGSGSDAGNLEVAASAGFDTELEVSTGQYSGLTLKCTTGEREIWAVVNDSRDRTAGADAVATKADLLAQTHSLADARKEKLLMAGASGVLSLREGKEEIRLEVKRLAASVVLESVRNDFLAPAYRKAGAFRVEDCYLLNVPGVTNFGGTTEPSALPAESWLARRAAEKAHQVGLDPPRIVGHAVDQDPLLLRPGGRFGHQALVDFLRRQRVQCVLERGVVAVQQPEGLDVWIGHGRPGQCYEILTSAPFWVAER